ncbi:uncharacterized protein LOC133806833 [Humulus lupulus]|uniref:uncharacterized protein LOC133806833 n=1 Tax=Humulus lupulus TaxID=3486 RepID=UPI002B40193D|nr:uncharacterized protein LOC133806833 [Humulus lupulus]
MPYEDAFDIYTNAEALANKTKASKRHQGESSSDPSKKKARTEDPPVPPPAPTPSRNTTTPPPPPPRSNSPPEQERRPSANDPLSSDFNDTYEKLQRLSKHRLSQEAFSHLPPLPNNQVISRRLSVFSCSQGILTIGHNWRRAEESEARFVKEIKAIETRYAKEMNAVEAKQAEEVKAVEARVAEELKATEARVTNLSEELRRCQESVVKITAFMEKFKEASEINFKEASKLQDDLVIT